MFWGFWQTFERFSICYIQYWLYLRWLKARIQWEPRASLLLALSPLLWLRALSPIKAWASSASSLWLQISWALCSASWSPAALNSLWSCQRFTLLKMLAEPTFLFLLSARRHGEEEGPTSTEAEGEAAPVSIQRYAGKTASNSINSVGEEYKLNTFAMQK